MNIIKTVFDFFWDKTLEVFSEKEKSKEESCKEDVLPFLRSIQEIAIYGYGICGVWGVQGFFQKFSGKRIYTYADAGAQTVTLSNRILFLREGLDTVTRKCKNIATAIIAENYLRQSENFPLIPLVFCTESNMREDLPSVEEIACSKGLNGRITHSELRRVYKLLHDPSLPEEIRRISERTFLFVKVCSGNKEGQFSITRLEKIPAPWDNTPQDPTRRSRFEEAMRRRPYLSSKVSTRAPDRNWREELNRICSIANTREILPDMNKNLVGA